MVEQMFLSPQVKGSLIISTKVVYTRCLTSCGTVQDLGSEETSNYQGSLSVLPKIS